MMRDWPEIVRMIPTALIDEACKEIESTYFYVEPDNDDPSFYIRTAAEENISHLIHLDVRHTPHDTGKTLTAYDLRHCNITPVVTWTKIRQEDHEHTDDAAEERRSSKSVHILGPASKAFPAPLGWQPMNGPTHPSSLLITSPAQLTIKRLTHLLQYRNTGRERPTCETTWQTCFPGPPIPWPEI